MINFNQQQQKLPPQTMRVTIDIRPDLITHWGGLVINNFVVDPVSKAVIADNITTPGFMYNFSKNPDEPTFKITTGVLDESKKSRNKNRPKRKATRKKITHKKTVK